ncbi:hypothetical protein SERLADRAFT_372280 [Serpula lacrymans var. lacrymans S7.9]|uniref:Uncharacterized protein n=1 Tax=Serpula lacrymans var. lacrymans (strain S7.9) TaxID=578457 RepID=F8P4V2_SERL9|nr:uncharacterized protein SERLADRAFT_372280 [Serpula lacrymans var. lacrymans S7.9]EGO21639.1 hypothetical protein SERLADRAFT_372280 [Serpula lacrymans var. lacrymans S7.9]
MRRFLDPRVHENQTSSSQSSSPPEIYHQPQVQTYDNPYPYAAPSDVPIHQSAPPDANRDYMETPPRTGPDHYQPLAYTAPYGVVTHATEHDANYWRNMFMELGFGANGDQPVSFHDGFRVPPHGHGNPGPPSYHLNQAVYGQ